MFGFGIHTSSSPTFTPSPFPTSHSPPSSLTPPRRHLMDDDLHPTPPRHPPPPPRLSILHRRSRAEASSDSDSSPSPHPLHDIDSDDDLPPPHTPHLSHLPPKRVRLNTLLPLSFSTSPTSPPQPSPAFHSSPQSPPHWGAPLRPTRSRSLGSSPTLSSPPTSPPQPSSPPLPPFAPTSPTKRPPPPITLPPHHPPHPHSHPTHHPPPPSSSRPRSILPFSPRSSHPHFLLPPKVNHSPRASLPFLDAASSSSPLESLFTKLTMQDAAAAGVGGGGGGGEGRVRGGRVEGVREGWRRRGREEGGASQVAEHLHLPRHSRTSGRRLAGRSAGGGGDGEWGGRGEVSAAADVVVGACGQRGGDSRRCVCCSYQRAVSADGFAYDIFLPSAAPA